MSGRGLLLVGAQCEEAEALQDEEGSSIDCSGAFDQGGTRAEGELTVAFECEVTADFTLALY